MRVLVFIAFGVLVIVALTRWGDPPVTLVDATPACAAKPLPNPCAKKIDCYRVNPKVFT